MTTTATATIDKVAPDTSAAPRMKPRIRDIRLNNQTDFKIRHLVAFAPVGFEESDLRDPECWAGDLMQVHDHVYVVGPNQSWSADVVCTWTNNKDAVVSITKLHRFNVQRDPLFSDDNYAVIASRSAFDVIRKRDGQPVAEGLHTEALAITTIRNQYPRRL